MLAVAFMVSAMTVNVATAAVSLKSSGDQWGPAVQDLMNAKENGNWNEARFISTFNSRFNGTAEEAKALLNSLKAGNVPSSASEFNNSINTPNPGNGNGNGNSGNNGGSTCTGNPHDCNSGSGITQDQLDASQKAQDDKQLAKDNSQDKAIAGKADQSALTDVSVKTDHAFDIAVEGRATANNALSTVYGLIPQVLDNGKKITDVDTKVDANKAEQANRDKGQDDHINAVQGAAQTANDRATDLEKRADVAEGAIRETNEQLAVTDGRSIDNAKRLDGVEAKNDDQDKAIAGKADQSALDNEVSERQKGDDKLQANINTEAKTRADADTALKNNIDANKEAQAKTDARQDQDLSTETDNRVSGDKALKANIDKNKAEQVVTDSNQDKVIATKASKKELANETASRQSADDKLSSRIDSNDATLVQHDQRITSNTQRIGSVEGRVSNLEQSTNKRFSDVDKRIGENRKVASAGIAGAGAMANIPGLTKNGNFSVGAGIGGYDGEQAVAVGFNARISENVTTKVTVSTNTQSEVLWGAGVGVEW
ncbi:adhesin [Xanthomonas phage XbC2]|nr:adhesin [Xanthomonas phage XbC2]